MGVSASFVWFGVYMDISVPWTRYAIVLDLGWHRIKRWSWEPAEWSGIWALGYRYRTQK